MESVTRAMNQCRLAGSFAQKGRVLVHLEGRLRDQQQHPVIDLPDPEEMKSIITTFLEGAVVLFKKGLEVDLSSHALLNSALERLVVAEVETQEEEDAEADEDVEGRAYSFWQADTAIHLYSCYDRDPISEFINEDEQMAGVAAYTATLCPTSQLEGLYESLWLSRGLKQELLSYVETSLLFSRLGVDPLHLTASKVILLTGPPGVGKSSVIRALSQKLAIRLSDTYCAVELLCISCHALLSKFFSESGKLVCSIFSKIYDRAYQEPESIFVLQLDEVESLTASREKAASGQDPSDAVRVVNAVLCQVDRISDLPNVVIACTSNLANSVDAAFADRAGFKAHIGNPPAPGRYQLLRSALLELMRVGIIAPPSTLSQSLPPTLRAAMDLTSTQEDDKALDAIRALVHLVQTSSEGLSGRSLKSAALRAYARIVARRRQTTSTPFADMVTALRRVTEEEVRAQSLIKHELQQQRLKP